MLNGSKLVYYQATLLTGEITNIDCGLRIISPPSLHGIVMSTRTTSAENGRFVVLGSHHGDVFDPFVCGNLTLFICTLRLETFLARIVCAKKILLEVFNWIIIRVRTKAVIDFD